MKNLSQYIANFIRESKDSKYIKLDFSGVNGGADLVQSIKSVATSNIITYSGDSQEDIKLKLDDSKISGFEKITELLTEFLNSISSEEHDNIGEQLDKINTAIDKLNDWMTEVDSEQNTEETPEKDSEEPNKKDK
jgi:hypothetical protein